MEDYVKLRFARGLGFSSPANKPEDCPQWLADIYDLHNRHYQAMLRNRECPNTEYALLATIATLVHELQDRCTELEKKMAAIETMAGPAQMPTAPKPKDRRGELVGV